MHSVEKNPRFQFRGNHLSFIIRPEYFGLGNGTIRMLIQGLDGAQNLAGFKKDSFEKKRKKVIHTVQ